MEGLGVRFYQENTREKQGMYLWVYYYWVMFYFIYYLLLGNVYL